MGGRGGGYPGPEEANFRWSGQKQGLTQDLFLAGGKAYKWDYVMACVSKPKLVGSGGMLPQENFEIYNP